MYVAFLLDLSVFCHKNLIADCLNMDIGKISKFIEKLNKCFTMIQTI